MATFALKRDFGYSQEARRDLDEQLQNRMTKSYGGGQYQRYYEHLVQQWQSTPPDGASFVDAFDNLDNFLTDCGHCTASH